MEVVFAVAVALAGLSGLAFERVLRRRQALRLGGFAFAAGTLLSMILLHVMPEAMAGSRHATILFVVGFVLMMAAHQHGLRADPCCGHDEHARHGGLPSLAALCLCSLNDGFVLYSDVSSGLASPLLWAMCVHQATAAFALLMLLRELGALTSRRRMLLYMAAFLAATPLSLLLAAQLATTTTLFAHLLALAAGALLYVIAGSMVPRVEHLAREGVGAVMVMFLAAVLLNVGVQLVAPHRGDAHAAPPAAPPAAPAPGGGGHR